MVRVRDCVEGPHCVLQSVHAVQSLITQATSHGCVLQTSDWIVPPQAKPP
jgi:hypothetical protein